LNVYSEITIKKEKMILSLLLHEEADYHP